MDLGTASEAALGELRAALLEHQVLFLRGQYLGHAVHVAFARRWGDITRRPPPHRGSSRGFPEILTVTGRPSMTCSALTSRSTRRRGRPGPPAGTRPTPAVNPPSVSILRAQAVPSFGGDTQWASITAAYAGLVRAAAGPCLRAAHRARVLRRVPDDRP